MKKKITVTSDINNPHNQDPKNCQQSLHHQAHCPLCDQICIEVVMFLFGLNACKYYLRNILTGPLFLTILNYSFN
jgi:hypothetical protein